MNVEPEVFQNIAGRKTIHVCCTLQQTKQLAKGPNAVGKCKQPASRNFQHLINEANLGECLSCCHYSGSQHRATRGSCVEEDRSRFHVHGSSDGTDSASHFDGVHGAAARAARMRSAWVSG